MRLPCGRANERTVLRPPRDAGARPPSGGGQRSRKLTVHRKLLVLIYEPHAASCAVRHELGAKVPRDAGARCALSRPVLDYEGRSPCPPRHHRLTRAGPGTPAGALLRRYGQAPCPAADLTGEKLVSRYAAWARTCRCFATARAATASSRRTTGTGACRSELETGDRPRLSIVLIGRCD